MKESNTSMDATPARRIRRRITSREGPDPVDLYVGERMRLRRVLMGISQHELGTRLNVSFQQIQKYEKGINRISASTLFRLAEALDVPIAFFFDGHSHTRPSAPSNDALVQRESLELLRNYYCIDQGLRRQIYDLVKAMRDNQGGSPAQAP